MAGARAQVRMCWVSQTHQGECGETEPWYGTKFTQASAAEEDAHCALAQSLPCAAAFFALCGARISAAMPHATRVPVSRSSRGLARRGQRDELLCAHAPLA